MSNCSEQPVGNKLNVPGHEFIVHADEVARESITNELPLCCYSTPDDRVNSLIWKLVLQHTVQHASELCVQALVTRNQLIRESEAWHEAALLQPIDGTERTAEQDALHCRKGKDSFSKAVVFLHPLHGPLRLIANCWHGVNSIENPLLLRWFLDVLLDQKRVGFRVDVLHCHLEPIESPRFR